MKLRPQFNLRFRDAEQFKQIQDIAAARGLAVNEWLLRQAEASDDVALGLAAIAGLNRTKGGTNGKEKVAEVSAEKAGEIGGENGPSEIQSDGVGGKGGSIRSPTKGFEVGNNAKIATGGSAGVASAGISPEGKRGVRKGAAGDHGKLLRGQSVSVAAAPEGKFRGTGKCPHGWVDWMTCRNNGGGCE